MKKILGLLVLLLLLFTKTFAQNNLPPVYEIKTDTATYLQLDNDKWQMLQDTIWKLSFEQVSNPPLSNSFHLNASSKLNYSTYAYWFRYRLKNILDHDIQITIASDANYCDLYVNEEGERWTHYITGSLIPFSKRDGLKSINAIVLTLKRGRELMIYKRERGTPYFYPKYVKPAIGFKEKVIEKSYINDDAHFKDAFLECILGGILIIAGIFNLLFYRIIREKIYLYFSLFLVFQSFVAFADPAYFIFLKEHPILFVFSSSAVIIFEFFYLIYFVRSFLELPKYFPQWNNFLNIINCFLFLNLIPPLLFPFLSDVWYNLLGLWTFLISESILLTIFTSFLLSLKIKSLRKQIKNAFPFLFLYGCVQPLITIYTTLNWFYDFNLPTPAWINWYSNNFMAINVICNTALVLFFSRNLFQRYRYMQKKISQQALETEIERSQLIEQQKVELEKTVEERTAELKTSLHELKSTQSQLIQVEKMASLGELTAGIAHEIQNPLNFVNNFSEVNKEMIDELQGERLKVKGERNEEVEDEIINNIKENEEKINHHGKRADAIVKNMLQHSKQTKGIKEPTDINALCDEYLRLSYHGMRAKDKNFNADFKTDFDKSIEKINIVPQDMGRVLLNLFNNAFYAVNEKLTANRSPLTDNYKPLVIVQTKKVNDKVEIKVSDNGNGIPQNIIDKIFQPFFTTKPTGQGTGLGLSLAYDIITKEHNGTIKVESKEGEGSVFIIILPS